jgi:hypothetical protein
MAIKWRDLRDAYVLSTAHDDEVKLKFNRQGENTKNIAECSG